MNLSKLTLALVLVMAPRAAAAQEVRGRVVDERTRQAVPGAAVTLLDADSAVVTRVETGNDGFFTVEVRRAGAYTITVESVGYAPVTRSIEVGGEDMVVPAFVLTSQTIQLDSVNVEVDSRAPIDRAAVGFARASHVVAGERLATLERQGIRFPSAMRDLGAGLRVREWIGRDGMPHVCIESNRRIGSMRGGGDCEWPAIVIDGVVLGGNPESTVRTLDLQNFESIEFYTPVEAGTRFGLEASAGGALVLWTRGRGPHVSEKRNGG